MTLKTLYKRTKTGAIQQYTISTGLIDHIPTIVKQTGQLSGKLTVHKEPVTQGKNIGKSNETTAVEQAESQAKSDWTKKHDEGYKSAEELNYKVVNAANPNELQQYLEKYLPKFNTDANGEVKPMLAPSKPFVKDKAKYPQLIEYKLDGNRSLMNIEAEGEPIFLSRSGKPHQNLGHLVQIVKDARDRGVFTSFPVILDGEVYLHGLLLEDINEAVKKTNHNTPKLEFFVYDLPLDGGKQITRSVNAGDIVNKIQHLQIKNNIPVPVDSDEDVIEFHDKAIADGYEGAMLKKLAGFYCPGQRSSDWQKVKMFDDAEFEIVGGKLDKVPMDLSPAASYHYYAHSHPREIDSFTFVCKAENGETFDPKPGGTREQRASYINNIKSLIGKKLTVKYFGLSKYGIPNLPTAKAIREEL